MNFSNNSSLICAGIVTYNPNIALLENCVKAIASQVTFVVVVDNGSSNVDEIRVMLSNYTDSLMIENVGNKGIAFALNQIGEYAFENSYDWFLTLDQDTICPQNMIDEYNHFIVRTNVGMLCPAVVLRVNGEMSEPSTNLEDSVQTAITSGALVRTNAWRKIGGFWNSLFIDKVDDDFSYALHNEGFDILRINKVHISHQIGNPNKKNILGVHFYTDNYPLFRYYYQARNSVVVYSVYKRTGFSWRKILFKKLLKVLLGEKQKIRKCKAVLLGMLDGLKWVHAGLVRGNEICDDRRNLI